MLKRQSLANTCRCLKCRKYKAEITDKAIIIVIAGSIWLGIFGFIIYSLWAIDYFDL